MFLKIGSSASLLPVVAEPPNEKPALRPPVNDVLVPIVAPVLAFRPVVFVREVP